MEKSQFDTLMLAINGLNTKVDHLKSEMDARFDKVENSLETIALQTTKTLNIVNDHERRLRGLEGPSA